MEAEESTSLQRGSRPELGIPGTAPMIYVGDPPTTMVTCYEKYENGPGNYTVKQPPPKLVRGAWGRDPVQAAEAAAAEYRAGASAARGQAA